MPPSAATAQTRGPVHTDPPPGLPDLFGLTTWVGSAITVAYLVVLAWMLVGYGRSAQPVQAATALIVWRATRWWSTALAGLVTGAVCSGLGVPGWINLVAGVAAGAVVAALLPRAARERAITPGSVS